MAPRGGLEKINKKKHVDATFLEYKIIQNNIEQAQYSDHTLKIRTIKRNNPQRGNYSAFFLIRCCFKFVAILAE